MIQEVTLEYVELALQLTFLFSSGIILDLDNIQIEGILILFFCHLVAEDYLN
jgi:hypothetical protein